MSAGSASSALTRDVTGREGLETELEVMERLGYQMGGKTLPYQGWWGSIETPLITDCVGMRQELVSHKVFSKVLGWLWMLRRRPLLQVTSLSFGARRHSGGKAFLWKGPCHPYPPFVTLRWDDSDLPNRRLCFGIPWEVTWNAAACLIAASHAKSANTPKLQNWLQSQLLSRVRPVPWKGAARPTGSLCNPCCILSTALLRHPWLE